MLIVNVTLHSAITGKETLIAQMEITNDGTGDLDHGNYDVVKKTLSRSRWYEVRARVERHSRHHEGVWMLLESALTACKLEGLRNLVEIVLEAGDHDD